MVLSLSQRLHDAVLVVHNAVIVIQLICSISAQEIWLSTGNKGKPGKEFNLNYSNCSDLPRELAMSVTSIVNFTSSCVKCYAEENCQGASIEILNTDPFRGKFGKWNFTNLTVSVGPCMDECSEEIAGPFVNHQRVSIQLFDSANCTGTEESLMVTGCTALPPKLLFTNMSIISNDNCVDLFTDPDCKGTRSKPLELRRGNPFTCRWLKPRKNYRSISHCSYKCLATDTYVTDERSTNDSYSTDDENDVSELSPELSLGPLENDKIDLITTKATETHSIRNTGIHDDNDAHGLTNTSIIVITNQVIAAESGKQKRKRSGYTFQVLLVIGVFVAVFLFIMIYILFVKLKHTIEPMTRVS